MRNLIVLSCLVCVILVVGYVSYPNFDQASASAPTAQSFALSNAAGALNLVQTKPSVPAAARKQLLAAAKAHKVSIKIDRIAYVSNQEMTIVRAPITGIEKYSDADFAAGAPVVLMVIKSTMKLAVPNGSYAVKVKYPRQGPSGKAIFLDPAGAIAAEIDIAGRPVLILPEDSPGRDDHGESGIDSCSLFREIYGEYCGACACRHYEWELQWGSGEAVAREIHGWWRGRGEGDRCRARFPEDCRPVPPTPGHPDPAPSP